MFTLFITKKKIIAYRSNVLKPLFPDLTLKELLNLNVAEFTKNIHEKIPIGYDYYPNKKYDPVKTASYRNNKLYLTRLKTQNMPAELYISTMPTTVETQEELFDFITNNSEDQKRLILNLRAKNGFKRETNYLNNKKVHIINQMKHPTIDLKYKVLEYNNKEIDYLHFPWPEEEMPKVEDVVFLIKLLDQTLSASDYPRILIHCKAGLNRSGSVVLSYLLYKKVKAELALNKKPEEIRLNPAQVLSELRMKRPRLLKEPRFFELALKSLQELLRTSK